MTTQLFNESFSNYPKIAIPQNQVYISNTSKFNFTVIKPYFLTLVAMAFAASIWFADYTLNNNARITLIIFGLSFIGWAFTKINDTYIALVSAVSLSLLGVTEPKTFYSSLGNSTIWLMVASFIIAASITASGLSNRLIQTAVKKVSTVNGLFYGLTGILMITTFMIPSTSGRAALMLPIYLTLAKLFNDRRVNIALSLLFPSIILLSAIATLTGAGAHLVTAEIISTIIGEKITYVQWLVFGLPFALTSCFITTFVILHVFLTKEERSKSLGFSKDNALFGDTNIRKWSRDEKFSLSVTVALIIFWLSESIHGINATMVALVGALVVTLPKIGNINYKDSVKKIDWSLLLFMAATLEIGEAIIESGVAKWLVENFFTAFQSAMSDNSIAIISVVVIVSLLAHLVINSRTARSSILVPMVIMLAISAGLNATALAFISTAAAGFCLTLTVSAKPVMMFSQCESDSFNQNDLFRLSMILLPIHLALLIIFSMFIYPIFGLDIYQSNQTSNINLVQTVSP